MSKEDEIQKVLEGKTLRDVVLGSECFLEYDPKALDVAVVIKFEGVEIDRISLREEHDNAVLAASLKRFQRDMRERFQRDMRESNDRACRAWETLRCKVTEHAVRFPDPAVYTHVMGIDYPKSPDESVATGVEIKPDGSTVRRMFNSVELFGGGQQATPSPVEDRKPESKPLGGIFDPSVDVHLAGDGSGSKYDSGKPAWHLVPLNALTEVVKVFTFGAKRYGEYNWMTVSRPKARYFSAAMRHLTEWSLGRKFDTGDSGLRHLALATTNLLFLLWFELREELLDSKGDK